MTKRDDDDEDELFAAELALRLLDGEALLAARARQSADPAFAAHVSVWQERLAGFFDEVEPVEPGDGLWERVASAIERYNPSETVVVLTRRVGLWRGAAAAMTALAASLALFIGLRDPTTIKETQIVSRTRTVPIPTPVPVPTPTITPAPVPEPTPPVSRDLRVAALTPDDAPTMAVVSYDEAGRSLIFTPATLTPVAGHSHQLWVVPASGNPRSLGLVTPGAARRIAIADDLAKLFGGEATVAISAERAGGSRSGLPEGPIVAKGTLRPV